MTDHLDEAERIFREGDPYANRGLLALVRHLRSSPPPAPPAGVADESAATFPDGMPYEVSAFFELQNERLVVAYSSEPEKAAATASYLEKTLGCKFARVTDLRVAAVPSGPDESAMPEPLANYCDSCQRKILFGEVTTTAKGTFRDLGPPLRVSVRLCHSCARLTRPLADPPAIERVEGMQSEVAGLDGVVVKEHDEQSKGQTQATTTACATHGEGAAVPAEERAAGVGARDSGRAGAAPEPAEEVVAPRLSDHEKQRRSFAYGNVAIDHPNVTREHVDRAAEAGVGLDEPTNPKPPAVARGEGGEDGARLLPAINHDGRPWWPWMLVLRSTGKLDKILANKAMTEADLSAVLAAMPVHQGWPIVEKFVGLRRDEFNQWRNEANDQRARAEIAEQALAAERAKVAELTKERDALRVDLREAQTALERLRAL